MLTAMMDDPDKSEPVTEMTVLDGHRTVVVGAIGTGESDLLAYLSQAQKPRPARRPDPTRRPAVHSGRTRANSGELGRQRSHR